MSEALVSTTTASAAVLPGMTATAFALPADLTFDEWRATGHAVARMARATNWWLGDFINFGEEHYGEVYAQAISELGLDYTTLSNYAWVSRTYPETSREETLSWRHHLEAAGLDVPQRTALLARAKSEGLSTRAVRQEANRLKAIAKNGKLEPEIEVHATNEGNTTALCEILADVFAQPAIAAALMDAGAVNAEDDLANLRWQIARGLAEHGVLAIDALTARDIHALVSVPGTAEFRSLAAAIARQGPV